MLKEIVASIEDSEGEVDQAKNLMKRLRVIDFLMFRCNYAGHDEIGDVLQEFYNETNRKIKSLISRSEIYFWELDKEGRKMEIKFDNEDEDIVDDIGSFMDKDENND